MIGAVASAGCASRQRPSRRLWPWPLVLLGCQGPGGPDVDSFATGPSVVAVDSVLLRDTAEVYIGNPFSLVPDTADGSFLVSDFFDDRILRYGRDGTLRQTYGAPGEGPGEFLELGAAFILNDTVVVGVDHYRKLLQMFRRADGSFLGSQPYRGRLGMGYAQVGQSVVFPARELQGLTSVAIWSLHDEEIDYVVPLPDEYVRSAIRPDGFVGQFAAFHSIGSVVAWQDTVLSGMGGLNEVLLSNWNGLTIDTLDTPAVRRRGVPENIQERMDANDMPAGAFEFSSALVGLYRLSDGSIAQFHHDATLEGALPQGNITADIYLSVIAPDRSTACVDGIVPHFKSMRAIHTIVRDTVFLLDRTVNEAEKRLDTWIRMYRIDLSNCSWLAMK